MRQRVGRPCEKPASLSEATVRRAGQFAEAVEVLKEQDPEIEEKIMRGEGPSRKEVMENAKPKLGGKARQRGKLHLGRPSNGTQYAKMAVVQLEKISPNDTQRAAAFDVVVDWIEKAKSAPAEERQPEVTTDADGRDIPSHLEEVFGIQEQFEQFAQTLSTLKGQVQQAIHVEGLDYSEIRTTAGDLNGKDLSGALEFEENRHKPESAEYVSGTTPRDYRRELFRRYAEGKFQYLVNGGAATEGFDDPGIECIVMAKPTKSRDLFAQMVGRGTRPLQKPWTAWTLPTRERP